MTHEPVGSMAYGQGKIIWDYLRVPGSQPPYTPGSAADVLIMVLGSPDLAVARHAATLLARGVADHAVASGGCVVPGSCPSRREADVIGDLIEAAGIDGARIIREPRSENTTDNFLRTSELLRGRPELAGGENPPKFVVLVPTPVAERRALATGRHRWDQSQFWIDGLPETYDDFMARNDDHFATLSRMVGEVERILTYPGLGYMVEPDEPMPAQVWSAYQALRAEFNGRPIPDGVDLSALMSTPTPVPA
jgi:uncharacterized SAM-binding protein YcdF (DUF218 family)